MEALESGVRGRRLGVSTDTAQQVVDTEQLINSYPESKWQFILYLFVFYKENIFDQITLLSFAVPSLCFLLMWT